MFITKKIAVFLLLLATMLTTSHVAFAGGVDPDLGETPAPVVDSRICGREGAVTQAQTTRWTDVFATADPDTQTGDAYPPNTPVQILGRDFWGCWVKVNSASANGWVPVNALNTRNIMDLPILLDNSDGCSIADGSTVTCEDTGAGTGGGNGGPAGPPPGTVDNTSKVCGSAGGVREARTTRWTDTYNTADPSARDGGVLAPQTNLTMNGRDFWGCWVTVTHAAGTDWVPVDAISTRAILDLPQLVDNSNGCTNNNGQILCPAN